MSGATIEKIVHNHTDNARLDRGKCPGCDAIINFWDDSWVSRR